MEKKLNWYNLKKNKCPKCNKDWAFDLTAQDGLLVHKCQFKIREVRYAQIVNSMITTELEEKLNEEHESQTKNY